MVLRSLRHLDKRREVSLSTTSLLLGLGLPATLTHILPSYFSVCLFAIWTSYRLGALGRVRHRSAWILLKDTIAVQAVVPVELRTCLPALTATRNIRLETTRMDRTRFLLES